MIRFNRLLWLLRIANNVFYIHYVPKGSRGLIRWFEKHKLIELHGLHYRITHKGLEVAQKQQELYRQRGFRFEPSKPD